jgi:two-component system, NarL family, nitrate/nitrite response regulator NarL
VPLKLLLVDDHPLFCHGFAALLRKLDANAEIATAASPEEGLKLAERGALDLALVDLGLPGMGGLGAIRALRGRFPALPVVVVSAQEREEDVRAAIEAGAMGYIPKSSPVATMLDALRLVLGGGMYVPPLLVRKRDARDLERRVVAPRGESAAQVLTLRQLEVLTLLCDGRSNKRIAHELDLAEQTVKGHVSAIFRALRVLSRTQAMLRARELGLLPAAPAGAPD